MTIEQATAQGWVVDEWRNNAPGTVIGWPEDFHVGMKQSGLPWMIRKQKVDICVVCHFLSMNGPDAWTYCSHNQPERRDEA